MKDRIKYLDKLRFFAIFCIIMLHVLSIFRWKYFSINTTNFLLMTLIDTFTRVGIPIFFMLTGILMFQKQDENYKVFLKKRVLKLFYSYFFACIIYYGYNIIVKKVPISIYEFLREVTSGSVEYHLWYMPVIILIYILIPFIKKIAENLKQEELRNMIGIVFVLSNVFIGISSLLAANNYYLLQKFTFPNLIGYMNYLFLGYYLYKYDIKITKKLILLSIISILLIPICTYLVSTESINDVFLDSLSLFVFYPSCFIFIWFKNHKNIEFSKKIENFIKKNVDSIFYVYLIHVLVLSIIQNICLKIISNASLEMDFLLIITFWLITTIISFLLAIVWLRLKQWIMNHYEKISIILMHIISILFIVFFILVLGNLLLNPYHFIKLNRLETGLGILGMIGLYYFLYKF